MTTKGMITEQAAPSTTHVDPNGGGANPPVSPETAAEKTLWQKSSPWVHGVLGVASFVPGLSVVTGALDAGIYAAEGDYVGAGIAAVSMVPGGKMVTTVGMAAKGAVSIAQGASTAVKAAKATKDAVKAAKVAEDAVKAAKAVEDAAKAAKAAEDAAKAAKTAKAAEDAAKAASEGKAAKDAADKAADAASSAKKPKKEVTVKARQHKVPCFHPFDKKKFMRMNKADQKAYLKEMADQLKRQENAINSLTANEYKAARDAFGAMNRNPAASGAQEAFRERFSARISASIRDRLRKSGMGAAKADSEAAIRAEAVMDKLAALHDPDMVAGGWMHPEPTGMGRRDVNSSIGGSWNQNDRVGGMDREADRAIAGGDGDKKMNVKLEPCRGKGIR